MKKRYSLCTVIAACIAAAALTAGTAIGIWLGFCGGIDGYRMLRKLRSVQQVISDTYIGEANTNTMANNAAEGMLEGLNDRWSYYMTAAEYEDYQKFSANMSTGIGVTVAKRKDGALEVVAVGAGTPAEAAGVETGWIIASLDGEDVSKVGADELRALLLAKEGTFQMEFLVGPDREKRIVTLQVSSYYDSPVSYEMLNGGIGYIDIDNFEKDASKYAAEAVDALLEQGAVSLVFDVRNNPGGYLSELVAFLDYLLPEGELFVSVDKDGTEEIYRSEAECVSVPMAVLINAKSYSAAEFFAAVLREYDSAVVVGEPSTGKSRSQETFVLWDGSAVHISTRRYLTPGRTDLAEQGGVTPDIFVEAGTVGDSQLAAATKCLS